MSSPTKDVVSDDIKLDEAKRLDQVIRKSGIKKVDVVRRADFGSPSYLTQLLNGTRPINLAAACQLARALGVKIDSFSPRLAGVIRDASRLIEDANTSPVAALARERTAGYAAGAKWPFSSVSPDAYSTISAQGRDHLESIARALALEAKAQQQTTA